MAMSSEKSRRIGLIASHERKKEFDAAVKEVIRQRNASQQWQNAVRQKQKQHNRPGMQKHGETARQLDTSKRRSTQSKNQNGRNNSNSGGGGGEAQSHPIRRATVATGSTSDLSELRRSRAANRGGSGSSNAPAAVTASSTRNFPPITIKTSRRNSAEDIATPVSTPSKNSHVEVEGGRRASLQRRGTLAASLTAADDVKREVMQVINSKRNLYAPPSGRSRVSSLPDLSSNQATATAADDSHILYHRNDSWTLFQDPQSASTSPSTSFCGMPGIKLEDLVPTRNAIPTSVSLGSDTNEHRSIDSSNNSRGRNEETVQQGNLTNPNLNLQIDFELGISSPPPLDDPEKSFVPKSAHPSSGKIDYDNDDGEDCPRRKFAQLSAKGGSKSGGTGNTSRGSIFSSMGSVTDVNSNHAVPLLCTAIEEEGNKHPRPKGGDIDEQSIHSNSSRFSLRSIRSRASRRSRRLIKLRNSIRSSLTGKSDGVPLVIGDGDNDANIAHIAQDHQLNSERIRRHFLEREPSSNSITSAYSNVTHTSIGENERAEPGWRFRLSRGGFRNQSMSALSVGRRRFGRGYSSGSRRLSTDSGCDESYTSSSFNEFYDNELHSGMMKTILKSTSGRSAGLSLPTVDEGKQNSEKKVEAKEQAVNQEKEVTLDDIFASEMDPSTSKIDVSDRSEDTAESFYLHPAHEHPLIHLRPNQLFPHSPGWQCDLCMQDKIDQNEWAYVSTGQNYLLCEKCFSQNGKPLVK